MYQNFSIWDRLRVCIVGRTWPTRFYDWIPDLQIRETLQQISAETEQDLERLVHLLETFGVVVMRPDLPSVYAESMLPPPMSPRDHMCMLGNHFVEMFDRTYPGIGNGQVANAGTYFNFYSSIYDHVSRQGNTVESAQIDSASGAMIYQVDQQIYYSKWPHQDRQELREWLQQRSAGRRSVPFYQHGHIDGWFCPVTPGLIISSTDEQRQGMLDLFFKTYFAGWEVVYKQPTLFGDTSFVQWQNSHTDRWWIPGQEHNVDLHHFVDRYLHQWIGQVAETVFEVNMLPIDSKNVIVGRYDQHMFDRLAAHGVTAHLCTLRHKTFWDIGISCATCDIHRQS